MSRTDVLTLFQSQTDSDWGRGGGCENKYVYIILESCASERLESVQGKQMQIHHSGVKVKILEVEVTLEKVDAPLLFSLSDSGRLRMQVYLHYSQPESDWEITVSVGAAKYKWFRKGKSYEGGGICGECTQSTG